MSDEVSTDIEAAYRRLRFFAPRDSRRFTLLCQGFGYAAVFVFACLLIDGGLIARAAYQGRTSNWIAIFPMVVILIAFLIAYFTVAPCQDKTQFFVSELERLERLGQEMRARELYEQYSTIDCYTLAASTLKELRSAWQTRGAK